MSTEEKCLIAEYVGEAIIGSALGIGLTKCVLPKCSPAEQVVVTLGGGIMGWMAGRAFAKQFLKFCDAIFDTEFEDIRDEL